MDDLISRHGVAAWLDNMGNPNLAKAIMDKNRFQDERFSGKGQAMTELINRQKVLDLVRDICIEIMDECETYIDIIDGEADAVDREADRVYKNLSEVNAILKCNKRIRNGVRQLPSESFESSEQLEWIPCSERLPEREGRYLCTNGELGGWITSINMWLGDHWRYLNEKPIAWMPLPAPWKGEKDD